MSLQNNYSNRELIEKITVMFSDNDRRSFVESLPDGFEFKIPASLPYGGLYKGREVFDSFYQKMFDNFYETFVVSLERVLDAGDHLIAPIRIRAKGKSGREMEVENLWLFRVENGQIVFAQNYADTAAGRSTAG
jgi:ketosteroid isomerase-like protein